MPGIFGDDAGGQLVGHLGAAGQILQAWKAGPETVALRRQLEATQDRFRVGEVTRTDVAQAESRLAAGRSSLLTAQSNYTTSRANYRQVIGVEPGNMIVVRFTGDGSERKFIADYAPITKRVGAGA